MQVTIVTAVKDCFSETKSFLDSLINNPPLCSYEVILIDDCSGQETKDLLVAYSKSYGFSLLQNGTNLGYAYSNNLGCREAQGRWLVFLNNDLVLTKDWFYHSETH